MDPLHSLNQLSLDSQCYVMEPKMEPLVLSHLPDLTKDCPPKFRSRDQWLGKATPSKGWEISITRQTLVSSD